MLSDIFSRTQEACLQLNADSKHKYYDEVSAKFIKEKEQLIEDYDTQLKSVR